MYKNLLIFIRNFLNNNKILIILIIILILLKLPSLFDPPWNLDEGVYSAVAQKMDQGGLLYKDAWDIKSPGIYYIYLIIFKLLGYSVFSIHFVNLIFITCALILFFKIYKNIFKKNLGLLPSIIFIFFYSTPLLDGNASNTESFFILTDLLGLLFYFKSLQVDKLKFFFLFGLFFGLSLLIKFQTAFEFIPIYIFVLIHLITNNQSCKDKKAWLPILGFILPTLLFFILFLIQGNLIDYINMLTTQSTSYIEFTKDNTNILISLFESLYFRSLLLIIISVIVLILYLKSNKKNPNNYLFLILLFFCIYAALFSGKEYAHYILQVIVPIIFVLTFLFQFFKKSFLKASFITILVIIFSVLGIIIFFNRTIQSGKGDGANLGSNYYLNYCINYYPNFIKLSTGHINKNEYDSQFYSNVTNLEDLIFHTPYLIGTNTYVLDELPWYYPLNNINNPLKYPSVLYFEFDKNANINYLINILKNNAQYLITRNNIVYNKQVSDLVERNYTKIDSVDNFIILKKIE